MSALEQWLRDYDAYDMDIVLQLEQEGLTHPKKDLENVDDAAWNRIKDHIKHYRQNDTEIDRKLAKVDELFSEIRNWEDKGHALNIDDEVEEESTTKFKVPIIGKQESVVDALLNVRAENENGTMVEKDYEDLHLSDDLDHSRDLDAVTDSKPDGDDQSGTKTTSQSAATANGPLLKKVISSVLLDDDAILGDDGYEQKPQINTDSQVNMVTVGLTSADLEPVAESRNGSTVYSSTSGDIGASPMMVGGSGFSAQNYDIDSGGVWMEEDDNLRLSDDDDHIVDDFNEESQPREHYKGGTVGTMTSNASTVDLLMAGPEPQPQSEPHSEPQTQSVPEPEPEPESEPKTEVETEWKEEDDKLKLSDDEKEEESKQVDATEHYKITTTKSTVDLLMNGPEQEPDWKEEDDKLKLSDDEKEEEPTEHYKIATSKSTVDLLMSGPEHEPDWKEEDDKLKLSDDEKEEESVTAIDGTEHYKITSTKSTVDLLMNGPETEPNWKAQDDKLNFSDDEESEKQNDGGDGVTKYGKVTSHKSTVDLLMAGPDGPGPADDTKKVRFEEEEWKEQDDNLKLSDDEEKEEEEAVTASSLSAAAMALRATPMKKGQSVVDMLMGVDDVDGADGADGGDGGDQDNVEDVGSESDDEVKDEENDGDDEAEDDFAIAQRKLRSASNASARNLRNARLRVQGYFSDVNYTCFSLNGMSS